MSDTYKQPPKPGEQVGGTHYSRLGIEPIQFIETNGLGYHEGNVIKYVSRWRNKNGVEDLKKAKWYIERLLELEEAQVPENQTTLEFDEANTFEGTGYVSPCGCGECHDTPHKTEVSEEEQHLFDACSWFNVNKGLIAYPVYNEDGKPLGINVVNDDDETTSYTYGECRWYASQYLKQNPRR